MRRFLVTVSLLMTVIGCEAADAYFVRFNATGKPTTTGIVIWLDDVLFFNTNSVPVTVRFLGVSNGTAQPNPPDLTLPPGRVVSLNANTPVSTAWLPVPAPTLWALHLDIPSGVIVESRDEFYVTFGIPELFPVSRGKVSMPIFRALVPANQQQVHLGTDLGASNSRINVGIFNAGAEIANATISVRRTCDDTVVDTRTVVVPANTVLQTGGLATGVSDTCTDRFTPPWMRAVTVTVSQPSVTFISNVNDNAQQAPGEAGTVPIVGLAVAKNERF